MANILYRLGRVSYRRRGVVLLIWLALLAAAGVGSQALAGTPAESFSIPDTESQEAFDLLEERFPEAGADNTSARVVFASPDGEAVTDPAHQDAIADVVAEVSGTEQVAQVTDPFVAGTVSPDETVAYAEVNYDVGFAELEESATDRLHEIAEDAQVNGLIVELSGEASTQFEMPGMSGEVIGIGVAALVLILTFGSLLAAGMPLVTAIVGVGTATSLIGAATGFIDMSGDVSILATMLGLAVAIDYALFIVSRYRHELMSGRDGPDAAGRAVATAGSAVVFAGLTVVIALSGLAIVDIPMLTQMGLAAAFTVALSVLIALTLLPALLGFAKRRLVGGKIPGLTPRDPEGDTPGLGERWGRMVTRRRGIVLVGATAALVALAAPVLDMRLGLPDEGSMSTDTTQRQAYDLTSEGFGEGFNGPLMVAIDASGSDDPEAAAGSVMETLGGLDNAATVTPPMFNESGDTAILTVIPGTGPGVPETEELVHDIRDSRADIVAATGASVSVTGNTAINLDFSEKMSDALLPYLGVVVGLSILLLMLAFRSILVPIKAAFGFLLTMGATFGLTVGIFQWGWFNSLLGIEQTGPIISILPIVLIGVVFGLAMDYEVFLVSRMRETYAHGEQPTQAVVTGFRHGARVVTAAALIMISVFAGFVFTGEEFILQVGLALALAVAIDAFVVRMTIVPAVLSLLGNRAWWLPGWLGRVLPKVDIEGDSVGATRDEMEETEDSAAPPDREPVTTSG